LGGIDGPSLGGEGGESVVRIEGTGAGGVLGKGHLTVNFSAVFSLLDFLVHNGNLLVVVASRFVVKATTSASTAASVAATVASFTAVAVLIAATSTSTATSVAATLASFAALDVPVLVVLLFFLNLTFGTFLIVLLHGVSLPVLLHLAFTFLAFTTLATASTSSATTTSFLPVARVLSVVIYAVSAITTILTFATASTIAAIASVSTITAVFPLVLLATGLLGGLKVLTIVFLSLDLRLDLFRIAFSTLRLLVLLLPFSLFTSVLSLVLSFLVLTLVCFVSHDAMTLRLSFGRLLSVETTFLRLLGICGVVINNSSMLLLMSLRFGVLVLLLLNVSGRWLNRCIVILGLGGGEDGLGTAETDASVFLDVLVAITSLVVVTTVAALVAIAFTSLPASFVVASLATTFLVLSLLSTIPLSLSLVLLTVTTSSLLLWLGSLRFGLKLSSLFLFCEKLFGFDIAVFHENILSLQIENCSVHILLDELFLDSNFVVNFLSLLFDFNVEVEAKLLGATCVGNNMTTDVLRVVLLKVVHECNFVLIAEFASVLFFGLLLFVRVFQKQVNLEFKWGLFLLHDCLEEGGLVAVVHPVVGVHVDLLAVKLGPLFTGFATTLESVAVVTPTIVVLTLTISAIEATVVTFFATFTAFAVRGALAITVSVLVGLVVTATTVIIPLSFVVSTTSTSLVATFVVSLSGRVMLRFRPIVVRRLVLMVGSLLAEATFSGLIRVSGLVLLLLAILFG